MEILLVVIALGAIAAAWSHLSNVRRRKTLMERYNDPQIVDAIMQRKVWQGMTRQQLVDSWGEPVETAQKVQRTKIVETCKYQQTGRNRFKSRVVLENGAVTGWQQN